VPDTSVIIVNWNGRQHLEVCLAAVAAQQGVDAEVILVDNASTDGSVAFVRERFPAVRVVPLETNLGFAGGNNAGARVATGRYLAFLNNDTAAVPGWLAALRAAIDEPRRFRFATSRIVYMHDPAIVDSAGDGLTRAGGAFKRFHGQRADRATESREVFGACGAAFIMSAELFNVLGGFDEDFFASYEDVDLSYRARLLGYRCWYAADAVVHHRGSATLGRSSAGSVFYSQRNLEWMYLKNTPGLLLLLTLPQHLVYTAAAAAYFTRLGLLGTFLRAKAGALAGVPGVLRKRRTVQRGRAVPPGDIWPHLEPRWLALKLAEEKFDLSIAAGSSSAAAK
jgi:GT2 family glycosyltransferase